MLSSRSRGLVLLNALLFVYLPPLAKAQETIPASQSQCITRILESGPDELTLGEIRKQCVISPAELSPAPTETTQAPQESQVRGPDPWALQPHRPNYFLVGAWSESGYNQRDFSRVGYDPLADNKDTETQFQISFKMPIHASFNRGRMGAYAAYTNRSFWQLYNSDNSRPFRDINHEPELWLEYRHNDLPLDLDRAVTSVGYVHQSNGESGELSRSWDRIYAQFTAEKGPFWLQVKPWIWLNQGSENSDNPDIDDFMGHGEVRLAWRSNNRQIFSAMIRNQLESGFDRGAVELGWSFPLFSKNRFLRGYVQYFYGYGESLIDYNRRVNRIGVGLQLTDWMDIPPTN